MKNLECIHLFLVLGVKGIDVQCSHQFIARQDPKRLTGLHVSKPEPCISLIDLSKVQVGLQQRRPGGWRSILLHSSSAKRGWVALLAPPKAKLLVS